MSTAPLPTADVPVAPPLAPAGLWPRRPAAPNLSGLAGIGWRHPHYRELLERRPALGFIEVHSENFFADGGAARELLRQAREHYALSLHGVGLSLGSVGPLDDWHLDRLARLVHEFEPWLVSDHASFSRGVPRGAQAAIHSNDLLPLPFSRAALQTLVDHVDQVQTRLGRRIAVENVSAYLGLSARADPPEVEAGFLRELAERSGCLLLVDVNNIVVNAINARRRGAALDVVGHGVDWLAAIPPALVAEIHLAGHDASGEIVIDHHGAPVTPEVWQVYRAAIERFGAVPTLIEWDNHLPELDTLLGEASKAAAVSRAASDPAACGDAGPPWSLPDMSVGPAGSAARSAVDDGIAPLAALTRHQSDLLAALTVATPSGSVAEQPGPDLAAAVGPVVDLADDAGLAVYRHNARGIAARALGAAFPVMRELVGEAQFDAMAVAHWQDEPPRRGDLAAWGEALADWLAHSPVVAAAPYLPDMARLEWALHCAERVADPAAPSCPAGDAAMGDTRRALRDLNAPDGWAASLRLLGEVAPDRLALVLAPGTSVLVSDWPVVAIWQAHRAQDDEVAPAPSQMVQAGGGGVDRSRRLGDMAADWTRRGRPVCHAVVWRPRWRARLMEVDAADTVLLQALLGGASLAQALDAAAGLDFGAWMARALQTGLLLGAARL
ncbi:MAG: hypothetical protein RL375_3879 [Pseudomonadota bacterium]